MLESLKGSNFEPLTKEQLKNVTGGGDIEGSSESPNGKPFLFIYNGKNYFPMADKWTRDSESGEYKCLQMMAQDGTWETIV